MKRFIIVLAICLCGVTRGVNATDLATLRAKGNTTVPNDAPIQPPQAWVESISTFRHPTDLALASKGITHFDASVLLYNGTDTNVTHSLGWLNNALLNWAGRDFHYGAGNPPLLIDLSGNAIPTSEIDAILEAVAAFAAFQEGDGFAGSTMDLSGGTNGVPTVNGLRVVCASDASSEGSGGYLANGTLNGKAKYQQPDGYGTNETITWSGTQWEINVPSGDGIIYTSAEDVATPDLVSVWTDVFSLGSCSVTLGSVGKARCQFGPRGISWTVTTNAAIAPALWALTMLVLSTRKRVGGTDS